jgi:hypothetical protein
VLLNALASSVTQRLALGAEASLVLYFGLRVVDLGIQSIKLLLAVQQILVDWQSGAPLLLIQFAEHGLLLYLPDKRVNMGAVFAWDCRCCCRADRRNRHLKPLWELADEAAELWYLVLNLDASLHVRNNLWTKIPYLLVQLGDLQLCWHVPAVLSQDAIAVNMKLGVRMNRVLVSPCAKNKAVVVLAIVLQWQKIDIDVSATKMKVSRFHLLLDLFP